ncbi:MAG: 4'-phosphopantetheinyl transferase superfamily protein [Clostridiales bacterium]|nr:4'-phosphopantetheinyl transferase superfamily protein [Clostridiales bacterium]
MEVYGVKLENQANPRISELLALICPRKAARLQGFLSELDLRRSLLADLLARYAISQKLKVPYSQIKIYDGKRGKPCSIPCVSFSVSHSAQYAVCALGESKGVGIDIEKIRDLNRAVVGAVCSDCEKAFICRNGEADFNAFFKIWTAKESYAKCENISMDESLARLESMALSVSGTLIDYERLSGRCFCQTDTELSGYVISVCATEREPMGSVNAYSEREICDCALFSAYPKIPYWCRKSPGECFNAGLFRHLGYNFGICS